MAQPRKERLINLQMNISRKYIYRLRILKLVYVDLVEHEAFFLSVSQPCSVLSSSCLFPTYPSPHPAQKISFHWAFIAAHSSQSRLFSGA